MAWWDFFKVFNFAFTDNPLDPVSRRRNKNFPTSGTTVPEAIPDGRSGDGSFGGGGGAVQLRDTKDFVDLSTVTNRIHRYKEYERLRSMPEIETAMSVFADEACFAGNTKIMTINGPRTLKDLAENEKDRFLVYCYDLDKRDYTLGWAFNPRKTKTAPTVKIILDSGHEFVCTLDHRILLENGQWKEAGKLTESDELMPFYRLLPRSEMNKKKTKINQYPRIYTKFKGWVSERQFIEEFKDGKPSEEYEITNKICQMVSGGLSVRKIHKITGYGFHRIQDVIERAGFSNKELKWLGNRRKSRRVIGVHPGETIDVYDISVEKHQNFATEWGIAHNCQKDDDGRVFAVNTSNESVKEELEYLFFHRNMLNLDQKTVWSMAKNLFIMGDFFYEVVIDLDNPKGGITNLMPLPQESMYRMETTKGKLIEFQQSKEGPDIESLARVDVTQATESDFRQSKAIRFAPEQIVHIRVGDDRKTFYPYGVSLIEAARGPAHQLRLMEDSMVVYRLCLIGNTRVRTTKSYKYLKDIQVGDFVYSCDNDGFEVATKVTNFMDNGERDVFRVRSRHVEITGTETHPILVNRDGINQYVDIKDLVIGRDRLILKTNNCSEKKLINGHNSEGISLPEYVNEDFARLFGFLCGHTNSENQLSFSTSNDTSANKKYENMLQNFFGNTHFQQDKQLTDGLGKVVVQSENAYRIFEQMGYINDHNTNRIPEWVFRSSDSIRRAFVEGLSDANGYERLTKHGTWFSKIELRNKRLVEDVKELWHSIGLCSGHIKERKRDQNSISYSVTISNCPLPETENVTEVIPFGREKVYDITVDNDLHNFIANGIPVHNSRAPERRVFYIDTYQMPPYKGEAFVERMKDKFRKKKVPGRGNNGASSVEERWHAPAADEDYWIPIKPNSNTRVETLPGAQNLGEIDDTVYFRNKLFMAMNFPRNYFNNEDTQSTRTALSAQNIQFAHMIERLQSHMEDAFWEIADRHLRLLGYPEDAYEDLTINMTPPSDWRELTRAEVVTNRLNNAANLKGSMLMSDYDIYTKWLKYEEEEAKEMLARLKIQKLDELKMQIVAQNPTILGVGLPGQEGQEIGAEAGGPNPMIGPDQANAGGPEVSPEENGGVPPNMAGMRKYMGAEEDLNGQKPVPNSGIVLPTPSEEDIRKCNLDIRNFEKEMDEEEIDLSEEI